MEVSGVFSLACHGKCLFAPFEKSLMNDVPHDVLYAVFTGESLKVKAEKVEAVVSQGNNQFNKMPKLTSCVGCVANLICVYLCRFKLTAARLQQ